LIKCMFLICVLFLVPCINLIAQEDSAAQGDEELFMHLEKVWNDAHLKGDTEALDKLWADDISIIVPKMPVFSKKDVMEMYKSMPVHISVYESSDISVREFGDAAVVTGLIHRVREFGGKKAEEHWHFTKVYNKTTVGWRVILFQATEAPE
jgi:uncharacterized protein (TIGR02246 family)